jgi:hypothetical protein
MTKAFPMSPTSPLPFWNMQGYSILVLRIRDMKYIPLWVNH